MEPRTLKTGDQVVYFHSFFNRKFDATVTKVTKTRVHVTLSDPIGLISPTERKRSFTHKQADSSLI